MLHWSCSRDSEGNRPARAKASSPEEQNTTMAPNSKATQTHATQQSSRPAAAQTPSTTPTQAKTPAPKPTRPCVCGCGTLVRRWFAQGHDQRVRGMLQRGETNPTLDAAIRDGLVLREHAEHPPTGRAGAGFRLLVHRTRTAAAKTTKAA